MSGDVSERGLLYTLWLFLRREVGSDGCACTTGRLSIGVLPAISIFNGISRKMLPYVAGSSKSVKKTAKQEPVILYFSNENKL